MLDLANPELDWTKLAEGMGVEASRATTVAEFHDQFASAMAQRGPRLIEAVIELSSPRAPGLLGGEGEAGDLPEHPEVEEQQPLLERLGHLEHPGGCATAGSPRGVRPRAVTDGRSGLRGDRIWLRGTRAPRRPPRRRPAGAAPHP